MKMVALYIVVLISKLCNPFYPVQCFFYENRGSRFL